MREATVAEPLLTALGRVRQVAVAQGWVLSSGGLAQAPLAPIVFHRGFGSFAPGAALVVQLVGLDATRTHVGVTAWRGSVVVDGYDADRFLRALGVEPS